MVDDGAVRSAEIARAQAGDEHIYAVQLAIHNGYIEVAKGSFDRIKAASEFVATAASAIGTVYTALLGLSFGVGKDLHQPLPTRAVIPAAFLGAALALAVIHRALVTRPPPSLVHREGTPDRMESLINMRNEFVKWTSDNATRRRVFLQAATLCLATAVALLPLPFLRVSNHDARNVTVSAVLAIVVILVIIRIWEQYSLRRYSRQ